jgi:GLPGLI family protein
MTTFVRIDYSQINHSNMKKTFRILAIASILALILPVLTIAGGKTFEGVITYKISYPDSKFTESQLAMFPKMMTVSVKGSKSKTEMSTGMGNQTEITDYAEKIKITLLDLMGQKYAIKQTAEELQKEMDKDPAGKVEITGETKTIAGYACKKALVTVEEDGEKTVYEVWFTNELGSKEVNFDNPLYKEIDGLLMEFSMKTPQFSMKFTVSSVDKKAVPAKDFEIPPDYKLTTKEELKSKFPGME